MKEILNRIRNMVKRVLTTAQMVDSGDFPIVQVTYLGKTADVEVLMPYGISASPPLTSLGLSINVMGQEENRAAIISNGKNRFKNLKPGEVQVGNYVTKAYLKFDAAGNITLVAPGDLTASVGGKTDLTSGGNVTITAPQVIINGELLVSGNITDQTSGAGSSMASMRGVYNNHTHDETGTVTNAPNQPM